ncbi:hypothetical protein THII_3154 [Thioploca ingrica]|uniref:Putative restriction endonuclease domain-containing protein n=1 Tax=Thioploca ingrica TaxID=40754 RepID=A0A090BVU2_9GAMM|nr:hypothetical protein THII_3154 [Thioploca ingrica]
MKTLKVLSISSEDYLVGEAVSPLKHEYRRGQVYAMSGAKKAHVLIASNLIILLGNHLHDSPCMVFGSDMKVRLEPANCFYYPDVSVSCDEADIKTKDVFILAPLLVIEILFPATEAFDRGEKFADYRTLPSLQEYVLVSQTDRVIDCFRRTETGEWREQCYERHGTLVLISVGLSCAVEEVYRKIAW